MYKEPLFPNIDNFTPPERTPWGGFKIPRNLKRAFSLPQDILVGESWEISGHPSFPNRFGEKNFLELDPVALVGEKEKMPFLLKFLNSGSWQEEKSLLGEGFPKNHHELHLSLKGSEHQALHEEMLRKNLSVQVHPKTGDLPDFPSKTEAWLILEAEEGAGIYLGLKSGVTEELFTQAMQSGEDLSSYLQFEEVSPGELYLIPAGTFHAIGAGVMLLEIQESSESTFRAYDWGRPRPLHIEACLKVASWETGKDYRVRPSPLRSGKDLLVDTPQFQMYRFRGGGEDSTEGRTLHGLTVLEGSYLIDGQHKIMAGQSVIMPASLGDYAFDSLEERSTMIQSMSI